MKLLTEHAIEGSTYIISLSFKDESGAAMTPNAVSWTLKNENGDVINERENVDETPAETVDIVLQGDDLSGTGRRLLFVEANYNSTYGSNLPLRETIGFYIADYKND